MRIPDTYTQSTTTAVRFGIGRLVKKSQRKKPPDIVYHYTTGDRIKGIIAAGQIKPSCRSGHVPCEVVWFTSRCIWEPTANKMVRSSYTGKFEDYFLSMEETERAYGGLYRVCVAWSTGLVSWLDFKRRCNIAVKSAEQFERESVRLGSSPMEYFASFVAVPKDKWLQIETWNGSAWVAWDGTYKAGDLMNVVRLHIESGGTPI